MRVLLQPSRTMWGKPSTAGKISSKEYLIIEQVATYCHPSPASPLHHPHLLEVRFGLRPQLDAPRRAVES